jgi:organic radical activating enzyme
MEIYKPNVEDIARIKPDPNSLKVSGDQIFATLQGEGITAGQPAVFLRLHFCNLACSWCDTGYTWDKNREEFWKEPIDWTLPETASNIELAWAEKFGNQVSDSDKRMVITGGEPLLQQKKTVDLLSFLPNWKVEIETNGTITPLPELYSCQINCSPKLENSNNSKNRRFRPEVLKIINKLSNSWFKFVVTSEKDIEEIDQIVKELNLNPNKILIMPEGITLDATTAHLALVEKAVKEKGWNVTNRNQLEWFGNKRKT